MSHIRAALYLDFDNVFSGLYKLDPEAAIQFAREPGSWLERLSTTLTGDRPRRWLILRCYLNPAGWVHHDADGEQSRLFFSRFRPSFVRAGFEVIDCPRYNATKNGADIRIVVDAIDALSGDTRYDEFVIVSGDSDMTPLFQRLRRADRRTMIVSPADAAEAFVAIADQVLDSQRLLALVQGEPVDFDDDADDSTGEQFDVDDSIPRSALVTDQSESYQAFRSMVVAAYNAASEPLNLTTLAHRVRGQLGQAIDETDWFGYYGFARAIESLKLPHMRLSQHLLWDESRHQAPATPSFKVPALALAEPLERLVEMFSLPRMPQAWWPRLYETLSEYAHSYRFNLTQCTSWSRDRLRDKGLPVSRGAVGFVVRGTTFGGCPLHRQPPPTAREIGAAFVDSVLNRAENAEIAFTDKEIATIRDWLNPQPDNE